MLVITALGSLRQDELKFKVRLGCIAKAHLKTNK
jgi:hypothetical protein